MARRAAFAEDESPLTNPFWRLSKRGSTRANGRAAASPPAPFIVGAGRSGNTLLRLMLDSHPALAIPPESDFLVEAVAACEGSPDPPGAFLNVLFGEWAWRLRDFQIDLDALAREVRQLQPFYPGDALRAVYVRYAAKFGKQRWGDKTPRYLYCMPLVTSVLPEARFVHVIRDGRDAWQSIRSLWFGPDVVEEGATTWCEAIAVARRDAKLVPHYLEVRYEDLVRAPEATLRDICAYLELDWNPAMLRFYERSPDRIAEVVSEYRVDGRLLATPAARHRIHRRTATPPDASRIGAWRDALTTAEVETFEAIAGETLEELGYELSVPAR